MDEGQGTQTKYKQEKQMDLSVFPISNIAHWERKNEWIQIDSEEIKLPHCL